MFLHKLHIRSKTNSDVASGVCDRDDVGEQAEGEQCSRLPGETPALSCRPVWMMPATFKEGVTLLLEREKQELAAHPTLPVSFFFCPGLIFFLFSVLLWGGDPDS